MSAPDPESVEVIGNELGFTDATLIRKLSENKDCRAVKGVENFKLGSIAKLQKKKTKMRQTTKPSP